MRLLCCPWSECTNAFAARIEGIRCGETCTDLIAQMTFQSHGSIVRVIIVFTVEIDWLLKFFAYAVKQHNGSVCGAVRSTHCYRSEVK